MKPLRALVPAALAALAVPVAAEEPSLDSVSVEARVIVGDPATVSMSYFLRPAGAAAVGFRSIRFGEHRAANVRAFLEGREVSFRVAPDQGARVDGLVELPPGMRQRERIRLRLDYEVQPARRAEESSLPLPLLVVEWPPVETLPETFVATASLPTGLYLRSAFPTQFERIESIDRTSDESVYRFVLPVVPALLRLETTPREPSLVSGVRGIDLAAAGLLVGLGIVGWRRLRETLR